MTGSFTAEQQKTVKREVKTSGIGLFTGEKSSIRINPAGSGHGIVFRRIDLPGFPLIPATLESVRETPRCTRLVSGSASVTMVEHLLSALYAYGIDSVLIDVDGPEIPAGDGSAQLFVDLIQEAGIASLGSLRKSIKITQPLFWSEGDVHIVALPSSELTFSYTLHYPQSPILRSQYYSFPLRSDRYAQEIASCRTFSLYEEILPFIEKGMIKGGGLENALVIQGDRILNPGGARFPDEMVRHKILDLVGDLSLTGVRIMGHIISICSGHSSNIAFAKVLLKSLLQESQ